MNISAGIGRGSIDLAARTLARPQQLTLASLLAIVRRRLLVIVAGVALALGAAAVYLTFAPSRYTATTVLMPDVRRAPSSPAEPSNDSIVDPALVESQAEILRSDQVGRIVVEKLHLTDDPEFVGPGPGAFSRFMVWIGLKEAVPEAEEREFKTRAALNHIGRNLKILRVGRSYVSEISFTSLDPDKAATVLNELVDAYIQEQLGARFDNTQRAARWMSQRVTELKEQAASASAEAEAFRKANGLAPGASAPSGAGEPSKDVLRKAEDLEAAALAKKNLYESLLTRYQRVTQFVQQMFPITEARVLKRATPPPTRSSPKLALTLLLALFAGGILGTSGAFALEYFDRRIRNVDQLEASLGVRCLALLPPPDRSWRRSQANGAPVNMAWPLDDRQTFVAEGQAAGDVIRGVKLALDRARGGRADEGRIFAIASPFMGDEAASLATALAAIAARRGDRVLLITDDAPMRSAADAERPRPQGNLPYALSGANGEPLDALVHHDLGFDVFCKSAQSQRAGDLFMSAAGHGLVKRLRAAYDCVLISLPPVLERVDAVASAEFVDGFVLVANAGNTSLDDVDRALSVSALLTERLVGMVLFKAGAAPALHSV